MKRSTFLSSLGILAAAAFIPESKSERLTLPDYSSNADMNIGVERMRIYSTGRIGMGMLDPSQKLIVTNNKII